MLSSHVSFGFGGNTRMILSRAFSQRRLMVQEIPCRETSQTGCPHAVVRCKRIYWCTWRSRETRISRAAGPGLAQGQGSCRFILATILFRLRRMKVLLTAVLPVVCRSCKNVDANEERGLGGVILRFDSMYHLLGGFLESCLSVHSSRNRISQPHWGGSRE